MQYSLTGQTGLNFKRKTRCNDTAYVISSQKMNYIHIGKWILENFFGIDSFQNPFVIEFQIFILYENVATYARATNCAERAPGNNFF